MRLIGLSLLGIGFALGLALGLVFSFPFPMTMVFAHFLSTLFITPYLPLYFQAQDIESKRNRYYISYHLLETARRDFDSLFIDPTIPEETKKQALESLKALESKVEEEKRFLEYEGE